VGQKRGHFSLARFQRMTLAVKQDETPNPVDVRLLGPNRIMLPSHYVSHLIKQFGFVWLGR
jgi:hypothetical protein